MEADHARPMHDAEANVSAMSLSQTREVYPPLKHETREIVPTDCAAHHLNRQPQTLRVWACLETGPLRPVRISGRLGWKTDDIRRLIAGGAQ